MAVDTSFGLSPQSGLPQNNRVGDMDAFAALFVMKKLGLDVDAMARVLANESGLAGISGGSGDVRDLEAAAAAGDARARLALDVFVEAVRHYLGAFLVRLGGLDVLSFSGGIGENSAAVRSAVCAGLSGLGIELDPGAQRGRAGRVGAVPGRGAGRRPARARGRGAHRRPRGRRGRGRGYTYSRKSSRRGRAMTARPTRMPSSAATSHPAATAASTLATSPVSRTKPLPPRAIARWTRRS